MAELGKVTIIVHYKPYRVTDFNLPTQVFNYLDKYKKWKLASQGHFTFHVDGSDCVTRLVPKNLF